MLTYLDANGVNFIEGNGVFETMFGGSGADTLVAGTGSDTFIGDPAAATSFVIGVGTANAGVHYVIADFNSNDSVFLGGTTPAATLLNNAFVGAGGVSLTLDNGATVTFSNLTDTSSLNGRIAVSASLADNFPVSPVLFAAAGETLVGGSQTVLLTTGGDTLLGGGASFETVSGNSVSGLGITAFNGSFTLFTAAGDTLLGTGTGAETLTGSAGSVTLAGTVDDTLLGGASTHTLTGGAGNDFIVGGAGSDTIFGGAGDDHLAGGAGNDFLDGGIGTNVAVYSGPRANYVATTVAGGAIQIADQSAGTPDGTDTVVNIQSFQFTDGVFSAAALLSTPQDTTPPTLTPVTNQTDEATGPNGAVATFAATATDAVDGTDPVVFKEGNTVVHSGDTFGLGAHTITASATDAAGNLASEQFTITVQDTTPPTLTLVLDQTVDATGPNGAPVTFAATATDLVDGTDPVVFMEGAKVVQSGSIFSLGTHTITASATDAGGNPSSEQFKINVVDPPPVAADDTYSMNLGQVLGQGLVFPGVLANDMDVAGAPLTALQQSGTNNGLLTLNPDGSLIYQPFFVGPTIFTYEASNGTSASNLATVTINVNEGADTFDSSQVSANTTVVLTATGGTAVSTAFGRKTLTGVNNLITGAGNDTIVGNNNGDILNGGAGNDVITGGSGNDVLIGGAGNDRLTGGGGDNTFVFRPGFGQDTVADFKVGTSADHDTLDLRGLGFGSPDELLSHTDAGPNAVIHVGTDSITLLSVDKNTLAAHPYALMTG
jgi:Ca2+-binding RTX toxin-like protein